MGGYDTLQDMNERLDAFVKERDWNQFHSIKNLVASIGIEAAELCEVVQWENPTTAEAKANPVLMEKLAHEVADVMLYCVRLCSLTGLDPIAIMDQKFEINSKKYPADLVRGSSAKYTEYD